MSNAMRLAEMMSDLSTMMVALSDQMIAHFQSLFWGHLLQTIIIVYAIWYTRRRP